ncbi:hypothetical protein FRUB_04463 [Fimbriiglobus ruber]|uniref:Uncharacterized protein n=1 Tax=Fimbriiglobus ruber TaxID=1908690 RepID=A0A225E115_9BACT|nr:hypothetical protein FRUB_04463 [Fimbriiglobus ruber]
MNPLGYRFLYLWAQQLYRAGQPQHLQRYDSGYRGFLHPPDLVLKPLALGL